MTARYVPGRMRAEIHNLRRVKSKSPGLIRLQVSSGTTSTGPAGQQRNLRPLPGGQMPGTGAQSMGLPPVTAIRDPDT